MADLPADQRALLAAVIAAPDDDTPRLVYADRLEDAGDDVQAGYIRESVRLARLENDDPERPGLIERLTGTLREHSDGWAEALGLRADVPRRLYRRGFVHTLVYDDLGAYLRDAATWFETAPVRGLALDFCDDPEGAWEADWGAFATSPGLARLRELAITDLAADEAPWIELLGNPTLAGVRELDVSGCGWDDEVLEMLEAQPHLAGLEVLDLGHIAPNGITDALWAMAGSHHFTGLQAVYFGRPRPRPGRAEPSPELAAALTARFGDRWGNRRPPPPVWC